MPELPKREYEHYLGIDPGYTGALVLMDKAGKILNHWDMPTVKTANGRDFDVHEMNRIIHGAKWECPDVLACLEWPQTRPGEGHVGAERLGRGKGYLEAFLVAHKLDILRIPPNLWTGRLGLPGKKTSGWKHIRQGLYAMYYPKHMDIIKGPRGGLKDGRLDAALIAHWCRMGSVGAMRRLAADTGKGSDESMAFVLTSGRRKRKRK